MFTEEMEPKHAPTSGWAKDSVEVEAYVRGFARRRPDVAVTTLRFANYFGPRVQTPMATYFATGDPRGPRLRCAPAVHPRGRRPRCLRRATVEDHPGTFNVAGDGVILVSQAARRGVGQFCRWRGRSRSASGHCSAGSGWLTSPRSRCAS